MLFPVVRNTLLLIVVTVLLSGCGSSQPTAGGLYHIDQDGYGFGPGADKIELALSADNTFEVKAGPLKMLTGKWESKDGMVTFSKGEGAIVVSYRIEEGKLIPMKEGKEVKGWRWKK